MERNRRAVRNALTGAALLLLGGCYSAFFGAINLGKPPESVRFLPGLRYDGDRDLALDLHCPARASGAPLVVFFYGGKWTDGKRGWYRFVGDTLAQRGIAVAIPDYRHYPSVRFPDFMEDAASAVAWARAHAGECGADPQRLFLAGHSSGAHIAMLLATDARYLARAGLEPGALAGAIGMAGPYDFLPSEDRDIAGTFGPPSRYPESQPVNFVDGDEPPTLLLHGVGDRRVWLQNSERLAQRLRDARVPVTLKTYPGVSHAEIVLALSTQFRGRAPTLEDVLSFVRERSDELPHAGRKAEP